MKRLLKNIVIALLTKILLIVSGVVVQRFILRSFGSEINGLTSAVSQFLSYFTLLEAGLGLASIQALYKPLAIRSQEEIDSILSATASQYRKIGLIFSGLTLVLACLMPMISNSSLDHGLVACITILMGGSNILNYLFIGRYQVLLSADQRIYVIHTLDAVLGIAFSVLRILLINAGFSIIQVQLAALLSPIVRIIFLHLYVRKWYPKVSYNAKPDYSKISKRKNVLVHQIVGMITNHTDVMLLTVFSTLSHVSVYTVYNLIYYNISQIVSTAFSNAAQATFGKMVQKQSAEIKKYYLLYEWVLCWLLFCLMSVVLVMTIPFVRLYTEGISDVNYIDPILAVLFMLSILFSTVRIPAITMVNALGKYKETQAGAIIEAVLNLAISIPAFFFFGLRGLLLGTCVAMLYRAIDIQIFVYKCYFHISLKKWLKQIGLNTVLMVVFYGYYHHNPINTAEWSSWFLSGIVCALCGGVWFGAMNCIVYWAKVFPAFKVLTQNKQRNR